MNPLSFENPAFTFYALATSIVSLHLIVLANLTGGMRTPKKVTLNSEDVSIIKGARVGDAEDPTVARIQRAHRNLLENAVPFFLLGLLYVASGASARGAEIYFGTFVLVRILHSVFYLGKIQPFRTISFAIGALACFGMAVQVIVHCVKLMG